MGFPGCLDSKESACESVRDPGLIGKSPGEGKGYPNEYSCLENIPWTGYSPWGFKVRHN